MHFQLNIRHILVTPTVYSKAEKNPIFGQCLPVFEKIQDVGTSKGHCTFSSCNTALILSGQKHKMNKTKNKNEDTTRDEHVPHPHPAPPPKVGLE